MRADIARDGLNNWGRIPSWDCVQHLDLAAPAAIRRTHDRASLPRSAGRTRSTRSATISSEDQGATRVLVTSISEDDIREIVRAPEPLVGSDGNCVAPYGIVSQGMPHPRFYGTFPRVIGHYVGELGLLPLERAIHKMTGATARALKLKDRGLLKEGYRADIAIFDPADFKDRATYADPHQFPERCAHHRDRQRHDRGRERDPYRRAAGRRATTRRRRWR